MPLIILLALLLISAWFCFEVLMIIPLNFLHFFGSVAWISLGIVALVLFSWLFGD